MSVDLTDRQVRILRCIREWIAEHGEGPSIREIGKHVGLSSSSSVAYQLGKLEQQGMVSRSGRRWRSCKLGR
ncbi:MarR family transcriptional regulator [Streptomyces sp. PSKA54]|uniref:MarR family transcriptional regulator n=1 Tax=Streptomyces himalayensis subsp. aureolus TaxID=2758039 RepID=A0A7W2D7Y2_9ACTN|nr:MarR family transcriptional regulator [Streptomyces himalayensis]MBA4866197.1 MarR family transcriptional regulator [Streptomyces himalayensis subsp. aureolus]